MKLFKYTINAFCNYTGYVLAEDMRDALDFIAKKCKNIRLNKIIDMEEHSNLYLFMSKSVKKEKEHKLFLVDNDHYQIVPHFKNLYVSEAKIIEQQGGILIEPTLYDSKMIGQMVEPQRKQ